MIKLGILDFDTSHVVEFTKRLNHKDIADDQWVDGARVVIGCPGESKLAPEKIPGYTKAIEKLGVPLVDKPEDMIAKVDGMLIESVEGSVHLARAKPFLEAGLPCFIDKPFTCGLDDARKIVELADKKKAPIFSSSSLRYAPDVIQFMAADKRGKVLGTLSYGPASLHERNPGLYHYGIHPVEVLYTVMGPGCQRATCMHEKDVDMVTGQWKDGRVASVRGQRNDNSYGFLAFTDKGVKHVPIDTKLIYRELLKKIVEFFDKKKAPVDPAETVEIMSFIEAALKSGNNHSAGEKVSV